MVLRGCIKNTHEWYHEKDEKKIEIEGEEIGKGKEERSHLH